VGAERVMFALIPLADLLGGVARFFIVTGAAAGLWFLLLGCVAATARVALWIDRL